MISLFFCILFCYRINAEKCPGPSTLQNQEEFKLKYEAAVIVAYGNVSDVTNNVAKFQVGCTLKGQLPPLDLDLTQPTDVKNKSECHYLAAKKSYIVFLQVLKMNADDAKPVYGLANIEEIEINDETLSKFVDGECKDKEQYGRQLTLFYYDNSRKCGQLNTVCDETSSSAIRQMNYKTLTKSTKFLAGLKISPDSLNMSGNNEGLSIVSKTVGGTGDETIRSVASPLAVLNRMAMFISAVIIYFRFSS